MTGDIYLFDWPSLSSSHLYASGAADDDDRNVLKRGPVSSSFPYFQWLVTLIKVLLSRYECTVTDNY